MRVGRSTFSQSSLRDATRAIALSTSAMAVGATASGGSGNCGDDMAAPLLDEVPETVPTDPARLQEAVLGGPPDGQRLALDVLERQRAPVARIVAIVAIVAHHEHVPLGHHERLLARP